MSFETVLAAMRPVELLHENHVGEPRDRFCYFCRELLTESRGVAGFQGVNQDFSGHVESKPLSKFHQLLKTDVMW